MALPITPLTSGISALEARSLLIQTEHERSLARREGLAGVAAYMADLDAELEERRELYVAAAVSEIATLRGELFGRQAG
jgi:hypothetical protein